VEIAAIRAKFQGDYVADERTFVMGIDYRLASHIAARFDSANVLETCTGAGFTTMALARVAKHVVTVEVNQAHQDQARYNLAIAGVTDRVTFVAGDILDEDIWNRLPAFDAAFLDPDWAITGPEHVHRFRQSTMRPPADMLLERVFRVTSAAALVLPPQIDVGEFIGLPAHERQKLFLQRRHELYCLYFGALARVTGETECWL
jgi:tRNA1(Val) A37 N6-methylase TrmN6